MGAFRSTLILAAFINCAASAATDNWHQWRGPEHNGVSRTATPPTEWNEGKNVQWKTAIPGNGLSTPIIWGDKVFLLTAVNTGRVDSSLPRPEDQPKRVFGITHPNTTYTFLVLCLDRNTGQELWRHEPTHLIPHEGHHKDNNFAPASPVTDGKRLYCWFGSSGLFCYDLDGKLLWKRDLGRVHMGASLGEGTSPALYEGKLVIVRDHSRQSYIETLDAKTGKTLWKKERDEQNTWATPAIVRHGGRTQVITPGSNKIRSYDLHTGELIWQCSGLTGNAIPCPLIEGDTVICMTGYNGHKAMAIKLDSKGDVTGSDQVVWTHTRGTPYIPSPLQYDGLIWFNQSNQSMWSCIDAKTGDVYLDRERLPGVFNIYSSPVGADGRIYVTARNGITLVLKRDKEFKLLARNHLDDDINASPALVGDQLFLRGRHHLYCLSNKGGDRKPRVTALNGVDSTKFQKLPGRKAIGGPNVVILLADDLGSKDLGCYGGPVKTPVLDGLAARGVKFTDFHAGAAICSPSRATLLTGRQHLRTGIYGVLQDHMHNMHLLEREVTIAEVLQNAGYGTAHFGKWHLGMTSGNRKKPSPTQHGFDYWFGLSNGAHPNHKDPTNFQRNGKLVGPTKGYSCQIVVSDAINWLETRDPPDQPFFLNIWFNEPHAKIAAPDDIVSIYGDLKDEAAIYSATIDNTDRAIGRLVAKLKESGQLDNTLIIYSSDHGSYRPDRNGGLNGNKGSNFQGGLRSPGIFFWPKGIRGGRIERTPSGSVDLLPTICGLAGIGKPEGVHLDGADLSPLLTEKGTFTRSQPLLWLAPSSGHLATLRDGRYTLMGYRGYDLPFEREQLDAILQRMAELAGIDPSPPNLLTRVSNTTFSNPEFRRLAEERVRLQTFQESWIPIIKNGGFGRFALYDLDNDPLQKSDISRERPKVTARLKEKLLELYQDVMADAPDWGPYEPITGNTPQPAPRDVDLDKLLKTIEATDLPKGYHGSTHQAYVDRRMAELTSQQRGRIGQLWKEQRRLQPKMKNTGASFVRIMEFVAARDKAAQ